MTDLQKQAVIEAIKSAIMVEIKGKELYNHAVTQAKDGAIRVLFEMLAKDEDDHVRILQNQYRHLMEEGKIDLDDVSPVEVEHGALNIVDDEIKKSIQRGTFEMAVIAIGCDLERKAISFYKEQAAKTEDDQLKQLFTWLTEWEAGHLSALIELESSYQDAYWADQGFSPM